MQVTFLKAHIPLTKRFEKNPDGTLEKHAYPQVFKFTSIEEEVASLEEFHAALTCHAEQGHCLLKGNVNAPLVDESRAGSTDSLVPTRYVVFDIDGMNNISTAGEFIYSILPEPFRRASYILQHSASSGISGDGMRAHIFFMLAQSAVPTVIKSWLTELNLDKPMLESQIQLNSNSMGLRYPLDITVCQNDKLIYIAPPTCEGFEDPLKGARITLEKRDQDLVDFNFACASINSIGGKSAKKVRDLRSAAGLKANKSIKMGDRGGFQVLLNPEPGTVSGEKMVNGFMRINLAGQSDSWGHYYNPDNPQLLYNFKEEPIVELKTFLPDYWHKVVEPRRLARVKSVPQERSIAFRDKATDSYWAGVVSPTGDLIELNAIGSKDKVEDFYANRNEAPPATIPDWDYWFNPKSDIVVDWDNKQCNQWIPSEYIKNATEATTLPPVTTKIIKHVLAYDEECFVRFVNWVAYIYQNRTKTGAAWVLHGTEGTGKGLLFNNILKPIFGRKHCETKLLHELDDKFNDYLEKTLLLNVDEARIAAQGERASKLVNQLKSAITEPYVSIRGMRANYREVRSFTNYIFASNEKDAISISQQDRRFNVAPRQESKIDITPEEVASLESELLQVASFLKSYQVDKQNAHNVINNSAKASMRKASQTSIEQFTEAFLTGDLDYFVEGLDEEYATDNPSAAADYKNLVRTWADDYKHDRPSIVSVKDAHAAYLTLFSSRDMKLKKFKRLMEHKNITFDARPTVDGERKRGRAVDWNVDPIVARNWSIAPSLRVIDGGKEITNNIKGAP